MLSVQWQHFQLHSPRLRSVPVNLPIYEMFKLNSGSALVIGICQSEWYPEEAPVYRHTFTTDQQIKWPTWSSSAIPNQGSFISHRPEFILKFSEKLNCENGMCQLCVSGGSDRMTDRQTDRLRQTHFEQCIVDAIGWQRHLSASESFRRILFQFIVLYSNTNADGLAYLPWNDKQQTFPN